MIVKKHSLLFVDDEKRILNSLRAIFRHDYEVLTAISGDEALAILDQRAVDVIVSDQRMPGMLGNELLSKVHIKHPQTMRILLTGFMDKEAIVESINEGEIYRFINKPWQTDKMQIIIGEAATASNYSATAEAVVTLSGARPF